MPVPCRRKLKNSTMMYRRDRFLSLLGALLFLLLAILPAGGRAAMTTFGFTNVTHKAMVDVTDQLRVDVIEEGDHAVAFQFFNEGTVCSSITGAYFDGIAAHLNDPMRSTDFAITDSDGAGTGVQFVYRQSPRVWPGAPASFVEDWWAGSSGIRPGVSNFTNAQGQVQEWVRVTFRFADSYSYSDVIADLHAGRLSLGLHIQGLTPPPWDPEATSDAYLMHTPLPASVLLGIFAVGCAGRKLRRFV